MENGARPAAGDGDGAHWLEKASTDMRARVIDKITMDLAKIPSGRQDDVLHLRKCASQYEAKVFSQSANAQDYLRTISQKMLRLEQKLRPAVQAASGRDAFPANSSGAMMPPPQTAIHDPQLQNTRVSVNQAHPAKLPPVAQLHHPCHQTQQQQHPRMNQQDPSYYQAHNGQHANNVQTMQCGAENRDQPAAGEAVDYWREDMFLKITTLKDAHFTELVEFGRIMQAWIHQFNADTNGGQLQSLSTDQAKGYKYAQQTMGKIKIVLNFLQVEKKNIPKETSLDKLQTIIHTLRSSYNLMKARRQSKNSRAPPQVVSIGGIGGAADNGQHNHHYEQHAGAEAAVSPCSQNAPYGTPATHQQNYSSDNFAGEAESPPVAVNLPGDTSRFTGGTCSQEIQQRHPAYVAIPRLTQTVEHAPAPQQTPSAHFEAEDDSVRAEAERPVAMEVNTARSFSPRSSLASDTAVNLKHAFHHMTTSDTMDSTSRKWFDDESSSGRSCHKKPKKTYACALDEIRATTNMLVETEIKVHEDGAGGTLIELCYNAVSLTPKLREAVCASEISTKLLVHSDYPRSSPVILGSGGERKQGVPWVVDLAFRRVLGLLPEPRSIEGMAKAWDAVVRRAVVQFAHRLGGGTFSTRYGQWVTCVPV